MVCGSRCRCGPSSAPLLSFERDATFPNRGSIEASRFGLDGVSGLGFRVKIGDSGGAAECAISVGEHVWVLGREGEYVVMGVDRLNGRLQVLRVGKKGRP